MFSLNICRRLLIGPLILISFILASCTTFDSEQEGVVGIVYDVNGVKVLMDPASDNLLAFAIRNNSSQAVDLSIRALGGEISYSSEGGMALVGFSGDTVRAAYIVQPTSITLKPDDEISGKIFLKNWYRATKDFSSRFEFGLKTDLENNMVKIEADQDDIFTDSRDMFQQNLLKRNDPSMYGARHIGADEFPEGYSLSIPN